MRDLCDDIARLGRGEILRMEPSEKALDRGIPMERHCRVPGTVAQRVDAPPKRREWVPEIQPVVIQAKPTPEGRYGARTMESLGPIAARFLSGKSRSPGLEDFHLRLLELGVPALQAVILETPLPQRQYEPLRALRSRRDED